MVVFIVVLVVLVVSIIFVFVGIHRLSLIGGGAFHGCRRIKARYEVGIRRGSGLGCGANRIVCAGKHVCEKGVEGFQSEKHGFVSLYL